ncbi:hypothetical protein [Nostoc sp.]
MNRTQVKLTKIKFKKNEEILEIIIPGTVSFFIILECFFAILFNSLIILILVFSYNSNSGVFNILFTLFLLSGFLWLSQVVFTLFGEIRLRIDSQKIALSYKLFGILFYLRQSSLRDSHSISKLLYIPRHDINTAHVAIEAPAKLEIWVGAKNYQLSIPRNRVKTEVEIEWLVRELSDWLGIPIQRE